MLHRLILHAPLNPKHANSNSALIFLAAVSKDYHMVDAAKTFLVCTRVLYPIPSGIRERLDTEAVYDKNEPERTINFVVQSQDCLIFVQLPPPHPKT